MLADVVPKRFPLLRAKMLRAEARRVKKLDAFIANAKEPMPEHEETEDDILISFKDAALELPWKQALVSVGLYYNLTDETGRALNRRAARMIAKGKKQHMRARRDYYLQQKGREAWLTSQKERNNEPQNQERGRAETGA